MSVWVRHSDRMMRAYVNGAPKVNRIGPVLSRSLGDRDQRRQGVLERAQAATSIPAPLIGFIASSAFKGLHGAVDIVQAVLVSLACSMAAYILTVLVSLARAPKLLDAKRQETIRSLTPPPLTQIQKHRLQAVKDAVEKHGPDATATLRYLRVFGRITLGLGDQAIPPGMTSDSVQPLLKALRTENLVNQERIGPPPAAPGDTMRQVMQMIQTKYVWTILVEMEEAIDQVIFQDRA